MIDQKYITIKIFILFMGLYPVGFTYLYFILMDTQPILLQQSIYIIGKTLQFILPIVCLFTLKKITIFKFTTNYTNHCIGILSGIGILVLILLFYSSILNLYINPISIKTNLTTKLSKFGINNLAKFIILSLFYSFVHSFLEEYYWRWSLYEHMKTIIKNNSISNILSAICFTLHHMILIYVYIGKNILIFIICSLSVFIAGTLWNTFYEQYKTLYVSWISHVFADIAIFVIAATVLFGNI